MLNLIIYKSTLLYSALYHKRAANPDGVITLTEKEFIDYVTLVLKDIEEERSIANSFTYEIIENGEPEYNLELAGQESLDLLKTAQFSYDPQTKTYSTKASKTALSLKSTHAYPRAISSTINPEGFEEALNIIRNKQDSNESEPNL